MFESEVMSVGECVGVTFVHIEIEMRRSLLQGPTSESAPELLYAGPLSGFNSFNSVYYYFLGV